MDDDEEGISAEEFADFRHNEMSCDTCSKFMGFKSEGGMEVYLCG